MQTKTFSFIEQVLNIASGYAIALLLWAYVVVPYIGIEHNITQNLVITTIFTTVSLIRGYLWRRGFNWITMRYGK